MNNMKHLNKFRLAIIVFVVFQVLLLFMLLSAKVSVANTEDKKSIIGILDSMDLSTFEVMRCKNLADAGSGLIEGRNTNSLSSVIKDIDEKFDETNATLINMNRQPIPESIRGMFERVARNAYRFVGTVDDYTDKVMLDCLKDTQSDSF